MERDPAGGDLLFTRALHTLTLTAALPALAPAQEVLSYREDWVDSRMEFMLPWNGPAAAFFNPARIAETKTVHGTGARFETLSGKAEAPFWQAAYMSPFGLAFGMAHTSDGYQIDNSTAYYVQSEWVPMLAYRFRAGTSTLDLGTAYPIYNFNAFNAVKSFAFTWNAGGSWTWAETRAGRFQAGLVLDHLIPATVKLPSGGDYVIRRKTAEMSLFWRSPGNRADIYTAVALRAPRDDAERGEPLAGTYGFEVRPVPWAGLKWEVTRDKRYQPIGTIFRLAPLIGWDVELETDLYHARFLRVPLPVFGADNRDEGEGYLVGISLRGGF